MLHIIADIVTPSGVPIFYPLSSRQMHILPKTISHFGERIIAIIAVVRAWLLIMH